MFLKLGFTTLACSLCVLNFAEAARGFDKNMQNPRTVGDTSSMLQEMHGQMKLMQEQLGSLKASQQLLSAENAIKNLTPKVRKLEIHLERLEKQFSSSVSSEEVSNMKNDLYDLKSKLTALIQSPDTSVESTLSALNPTLDRMQKQVFFLYEAVKSNAKKHENELNQKMDEIMQRFVKFEGDIGERLTDAQGTAASLTLIRQALQHNHTMLNALKVDYETLKNEKINLLTQDVDALKTQVDKDELLSNLTNLKTQIGKLAVVFKKSLGSIESASLLSEKSLAMSEEALKSCEKLSTDQNKHLQGLRILYNREKNLEEQFSLVKTVVEQQASKFSQKLDDMFQQLPVEKLTKAINFLRNNNKIALEEIASLKSQFELSSGEYKKQMEEIGARLEKSHDLLPALEKQDQKIQVLYHKTKDLVSKKDLEQYTSALFQDEMAIQRILETLNEQNQKLSQFSSLSQDFVNKNEFVELVSHCESQKSRTESLVLELEACQKKMNELYAISYQNRSQSEGQAQLEAMIRATSEKVEKIQKQNVSLYKAFKELSTSQEVSELKSKYEELNEKISAINESVTNRKDEVQQSLVDAKVQSLSDQLLNMQQKLDEKDAFINRLAKRVAFLTKSLQDKLESAQAQDTVDINQIKLELQEKIEKELKAVHNDRLVFETLIQRIAALEASLNADESAFEAKD
jgi:DNA repair exonuclease SbcCD ATPase subunit